jgi:hypothetical protein
MAGGTRPRTPITSSGSLVSANGVKFLQVAEHDDDLAAVALEEATRRRRRELGQLRGQEPA